MHKAALPIFVAGSAHIDIIARASTRIDARDKPGVAHLDIGGTACNNALNLRSLGAGVRMLTALPANSPFSSIIFAHLESYGIDLFVHREDMDDGVFSAHIDADGEMTSAISCMPIENVSFDEAEFHCIMKGCVAASLDCNLSREMIARMGGCANHEGIPVFVSVVSEEKSIRVLGSKVKFRAIFSNQREADFLAAEVSLLGGAQSLNRRLLLSSLNTDCLVVTKGGDGAEVIYPDRVDQVPAVFINKSNGNFLGAGDALTASTIFHHVLGGYGLTESVAMAMHDAARVAANPHCNLAHSGQLSHAIRLIDIRSVTDHLTGLPNRAAGQGKMMDLTKRGRSFFVALIDIDRFKSVNDTYGHDIGDEALKSVADVLKETVRDNDFCCRWGGEEFLCLLTRVGRDTVLNVAERIRLSVQSKEIPIIGNVTISIGVAECNGSIDSAIKHADECLYESKRSGRNRVTILD